MVKVGVIGVQGAVSEHIEVTKKAMERMNINGEALWVKKPEQLREAVSYTHLRAHET